MDDLKIVFYIVVAIIWMVYNNYRKIAEQSKKRDPTKAPSETIDENWPKDPEPYQPPTVPNAQKPGTLKRKEVQTRPVPVERPQPLQRQALNKERLSSKYQGGMFIPRQKEGGSIQPSQIVKFKEQPEEAEMTNWMAEEIRNADFGKAIVLSEVLKRPYN